MMDYFYGLEGQEHLDDSINDVLERHFDDIAFDQLPGVVKVYEWRHKKPDVVAIGDHILEITLEMLGERYGNWDDPVPPCCRPDDGTCRASLSADGNWPLPVVPV